MRKTLLALLFLVLLLPALLLPSLALASYPIVQPLPELTEPFDQYLRGLSVMSQQAEPFTYIPYFKTTISSGGCGPASIGNALIVHLGVTDEDTAVDIIAEVAKRMINSRGKPIVFSNYPRLFNAADLAERPKSYPALSRLIGQYPGRILVHTDDLLDGEVVARLIADPASRPDLIAGKSSVNSGWHNVAGAALALHEAGFDNATIGVSFVGAGTKNTHGPLRTSGVGHYVSACIHVGTFVESGSVYILDSLPRALEGELFGNEYEYGLAYRFVDSYVNADFREMFTTLRISPSVVKLTPDSAVMQTCDAVRGNPQLSSAERTKLLTDLLAGSLESFVLFGRCLLTISVNADGQLPLN